MHAMKTNTDRISAARFGRSKSNKMLGAGRARSHSARFSYEDAWKVLLPEEHRTAVLSGRPSAEPAKAEEAPPSSLLFPTDVLRLVVSTSLSSSNDVSALLCLSKEASASVVLWKKLVQLQRQASPRGL